MERKFDIFKRLSDGTSFWIVAVEGREEARKRINHLAVIGPGQYLIEDVRVLVDCSDSRCSAL